MAAQSSIATADSLDATGRAARKPKNRRPALTPEARKAVHDHRRRALGVTDELAAVPGITPATLVALGKAGILTVDDLADCAIDDLIGNAPLGVLRSLRVGKARAGQIIMAARQAAGWLDEVDDADPEATVPLRELVMDLFAETAREDRNDFDEIDYPCPCCSQALPELPAVTSSVRITPMQARILRALWRGKGHPVMPEKIFGTMFADDPDGGPSPGSMYRIFRASLFRLRPRLEGSGIAIMKGGRRKGYWFEIEAAALSIMPDAEAA